MVLAVVLVVASGVGAAAVSPSAVRVERAVEPDLDAFVKWGASLDILPDVFAQDFPDAALVFLLAQVAGYDVSVPGPVVVPEGVSVPGMVLHLAKRAGTASALAPEDLAAFAQLDARVAGPLLTLLVAVDQAWTLRDQAFGGVTLEELALLRDDPASEEAAAVATQIDLDPLVDAAILLLDTLETSTIPLLQAAIDAGAWPEDGAWDPAGVLRLGSMGDDHEDLDRIIQIDPRGNDNYTNNAGGPFRHDNILGFLPINSIHLDFAGDDEHYRKYGSYRMGAGAFSVGIMRDLAGNDTYYGGAYQWGFSLFGVGLAHDDSGNDMIRGVTGTAGHSTGGGLAVARNDNGDDRYLLYHIGGGYADFSLATAAPVALLWDRGGDDEYAATENSLALYGYSSAGERGWFLDEGTGDDIYETATKYPSSPYAHGCNACEWRLEELVDPTGQARPRGVDEIGDLGYLIQKDLELTFG